MSKLLATRLPLILFFPLLCANWGCGAGKYRDRLDGTLVRIREDTPFKSWYARTTLPGTSLTYRIPKIFAKSEKGGTPLGTGAKAPFEIPDLKLTYEGHVTDSTGGKYTFYLYLSATHVTGTSRDPANALKRQVERGMDVVGSLSLSDVQCRREDGTGVEWQKFEVVDKEQHETQSFCYIEKDGKRTHREMKGRVVCYSRREEDTYVFVIHRVPVDVQKEIKFDEWGPMVPGSVLQGSAEAASPAPAKTPTETPEETPDETPEETPDETPEETPEETSEGTETE